MFMRSEVSGYLDSGIDFEIESGLVGSSLKTGCNSKYVPYHLQIDDDDKFGYSDMLCVDHAAPEAKFDN